MIQRRATSGGAEHRVGWQPVVDLVHRTGTPMKRASGMIWCHERRCWAVVSAIERCVQSGSHRYVQWCSLLGLEVECNQACLGSFDGAPHGVEED